MEANIRFMETFKAFVRPQFSTWKDALHTVWRCSLGLFVACIVGILFGVFAIKERIKGRWF